MNDRCACTWAKGQLANTTAFSVLFSSLPAPLLVPNRSDAWFTSYSPSQPAHLPFTLLMKLVLQTVHKRRMWELDLAMSQPWFIPFDTDLSQNSPPKRVMLGPWTLTVKYKSFRSVDWCLYRCVQRDPFSMWLSTFHWRSCEFESGHWLKRTCSRVVTPDGALRVA